MAMHTNSSNSAIEKLMIRYALYRSVPKYLLKEEVPKDKQLKTVIRAMNTKGRRKLLGKRAREVSLYINSIMPEMVELSSPVDANALVDAKERVHDFYTAMKDGMGVSERQVNDFFQKTPAERLGSFTKTTIKLLNPRLNEVLSELGNASVSVKVSHKEISMSDLPPDGVITFSVQNGNSDNKKLLNLVTISDPKYGGYSAIVNAIGWAIAFTSSNADEYVSNVFEVAKAINVSMFKEWRKRVRPSNSTMKNLREVVFRKFPWISEHSLLALLVSKVFLDVIDYSYKLLSNPSARLNKYTTQPALLGVALTVPPIMKS